MFSGVDANGTKEQGGRLEETRGLECSTKRQRLHPKGNEAFGRSLRPQHGDASERGRAGAGQSQRGCAGNPGWGMS